MHNPSFESMYKRLTSFQVSNNLDETLISFVIIVLLGSFNPSKYLIKLERKSAARVTVVMDLSVAAS